MVIIYADKQAWLLYILPAKGLINRGELPGSNLFSLLQSDNQGARSPSSRSLTPPA
jgi:hypothetical protein